MSDLPPLAEWDLDGGTIDLHPADSQLDGVLAEHGFDIDWSAPALGLDVSEQVVNQFVFGRKVEWDRMYDLMREIAHASYTAGLKYRDEHPNLGAEGETV